MSDPTELVPLRIGLSVVIPVHNMAGHIRNTLASLAMQTSKDFEVIVVDDGSTDSTAAVVCQVFAKGEIPRPRLVHIPHRGVSAARNAGAEFAAGAYVLFLDGDDRVAPDLVSAVTQVGGDSPDLICWGWDTVDPAGNILRRYFDVHPPHPGRVSGLTALRHRVVDRTFRTWTASVAYRQQFLLDHGLRFVEGSTCGEDMEFAYKALARARQVDLLDRTLSIYVKRSDSASSRRDVRRFDSLEALERSYHDLTGNPEAEIRAIARTFPLNRYVRNYFHTLESCLRQGDTPNVRGFLAQVEAQYPGLTDWIAESLRGRLRARLHTPMDQRLFLVSPLLWWHCRKVRRIIDRLLPEPWRTTSVRSLIRTAARLRRDSA
ncbi:glycosyltransferase family 2 protein [Lentzea sp. NPDC060358]|uniref:glycosyltransferase family 2 protein n=1 Tax=Lentzea sp. NPDC060358 TaxID=3347103 RepID=UPI00365B34C2